LLPACHAVGYGDARIAACVNESLDLRVAVQGGIQIGICGYYRADRRIVENESGHAVTDALCVIIVDGVGGNAGCHDVFPFKVEMRFH
jgi:hypothetical protein